jgi:hypothetical protein
MRARPGRPTGPAILPAALLVAALLVAAPFTASAATAPEVQETEVRDQAAGQDQWPRPRPGWRLRWAPDPHWDGLRAFEHAEDDRAGTHPAAHPHIAVRGNAYRFDMHMVDRDTATDRQRQEVRGMRALGSTVNLLEGERWRLTFSLFIPDTLKATTSFSHIMQTKAPGTGTNPMVVMSLRRHGTVPKIELKTMEGNVLVGAVDLAPLQNRWIDVELEMKMGDAPDGGLRWVVRDGRRTVIDVNRTGLDTWLFDRARLKWGIYRSLGDTSGSLQDTYMLLRDLRAYQWHESFLPPVSLRHEAERARIHRGVVASGYGGYTGTGFVDTADEVGSYVEWRVHSWRARTVALNVWYANGSQAARPMDVTVNGTAVAPGLSFDRTPAWNDWETRTLLVPVRAGVNTVRATATTAAGGPNLDSLEIQYRVP